MPFCQRRSVAESLDRELSKPSSFHRSGAGDCVPRPIQGDNTNLFMYFRGWCHYSTTTPRTISVLGKLAAGGIKDESCRKRRWWTCVPCETCGADPKGPELAKNNDYQFTQVYSMLLNIIYILIISRGCVLFGDFLLSIADILTGWCVISDKPMLNWLGVALTSTNTTIDMREVTFCFMFQKYHLRRCLVVQAPTQKIFGRLG